MIVSEQVSKTTAPILYVQIQKLLVDVETTPSDSTKHLSPLPAIQKYVFWPFFLMHIIII